MRNPRHDVGGRLGDAAAENPGRAALLSLVSTPLALKAGRVALRWARRNPGVALAVAAGALAWWGTKALRENGVAHDSAGAFGRENGGRSMGGDESSASSL